MRTTILIASSVLFFSAGSAMADELTLAVEKDLAALGYETGPVDGEETLDTTIAISKFQAGNNLEVTGEVTPQLAGILSARASGGTATAPAMPSVAPAAAAAVTPTPAPESLEAKRQACLQKMIAKRQKKQQKKRGLGRLLNAASRVARRKGNNDVAEATRDAYDVNATVDDLTGAARDLGLTDEQISKCDNPK